MQRVSFKRFWTEAEVGGVKMSQARVNHAIFSPMLLPGKSENEKIKNFPLTF